MPQNYRTEVLRRRALWCAVLAVPIMGLMFFQFAGWQWVQMVFALPVVTWGAWPFHKAAARAARHGTSTMDTLVSLGVLASTLWSLWAMCFGGAGRFGMKMSWELFPRATTGPAEAHIYFEAAAMVTTFLLIGRYLEARARHQAGDSLRAILTMGAKNATLITPQGTREIPASDLQVDDQFLVRPGEKVPTDGIVVSGHSEIDASLLTGESLPVPVGPGASVTGATINTSGALTVRATRVGEHTTLSQIAQAVQKAQAGKAPIQRLADQIAGVFVPIVVTISVATAVGWMLLGGTESGSSGTNATTAFTAAVAVLVIACPCALGLATPTALLVGSGRAARLGIVIKGPEILETTRRIDVMVLDKTGTVTEGKMRVENIATDGISRKDALALAAAAETGSEHPVARAIREAGPALPPKLVAFTNVPGNGILAIVEDVAHPRTFALGRPSWLQDIGVNIPAALQAETPGTTTVMLAEAATDAARASDATATVSNTVDASVDLAISGMSCAACVNRVQRKLNKVEGATATVNLATESAHIALAHPVDPAELVAAVEKAGYGATITSQNAGGKQQTLKVTERSLQGGRALAVISLRDQLRATSKQAIAQVRALGIEPILLTGDNQETARAIANAAGITQVRAQVLPQEKQQVVASLQQEGKRVAMVGDGVNDAAALAQAGQFGLGMAMGTGTDAAIEAADITLVRPDLEAAVSAIRISRATLRIIKQNLFWAFAYNIAAIPLAVAGLLNPVVAGAAMACSSIIVVTNSLRLRRAQ
ncbi:MAG: copper-translocating P-type ATPase [Actinomycetaceae bacterium]|nr:copper-translocating P-type ATPase [Actinomycetaceae bacterium]